MPNACVSAPVRLCSRVPVIEGAHQWQCTASHAGGVRATTRDLVFLSTIHRPTPSLPHYATAARRASSCAIMASLASFLLSSLPRRCELSVSVSMHRILEVCPSLVELVLTTERARAVVQVRRIGDAACASVAQIPAVLFRALTVWIADLCNAGQSQRFVAARESRVCCAVLRCG